MSDRSVAEEAAGYLRAAADSTTLRSSRFVEPVTPMRGYVRSLAVNWR
jgi:hypothetical protein